MMLRLRVLTGLVVGAALLAAAACSETLPPPLDRAGIEAGAPAPAWGLDVRPVSATCQGVAKPPPPVAPKAHIAFQPLTTASLQQLVDVTTQAGRVYVVDQRGYVRTIASDGTVAQVLDLSSQVSFGDETGLLSLAFHPKFAQNGYVYLSFTRPYPTQPPPAGVVFQDVVARFASHDGGLTIDAATEKVLLVGDQPTASRPINKVAFGPDGYLYIAAGDGGALLRGQDKSALFGKVLRVDVDSGDPYGIPPTNPFAAGGGAPEIYAYGFRDPRRFSFDVPTGDLWLGDVGPSAWEEIDKVTLGGNYGFATKEGLVCLQDPACSSAGLLDPVVVHAHTEASGIVGGVVYRGKKVPELAGKYIYGDSVTSRFWSLETGIPAPVPVRLDEGLDRVAPSSFALDADGEILFVSTAGHAYRIVAPPAPAAEMPAKLSATGCVDPASPQKAAPDLFPYDLNVPQWLDGATAARFLAIPGDAPLGVLDHGRLALPPRSVAMRTLRAEGRLLETQLLMKRPDATWATYTYAWSPDQKDALLATAPIAITLPSGRIHEVAPGECVSCHDSAVAPARAELTLGLEAAQLDRADVDFGNGRRGNPLITLDHLKMLAAPVAADSYAVLPSTSGYDTVGRRARAYLHPNCASCHDGTLPNDLDLRFSTALRDTHVCRPGKLASGGAAVLAPGDVEGSQLFTSVRTLGAGRMPTVGSHVVDDAALRLLSDWIATLTPADCQ